MTATLMTDELKSYKPLGKIYEHHTVNHSAKEYVRDDDSYKHNRKFWVALETRY